MALYLIVGQANSVLEHKRKYRNNESVQKEIGEETNRNSGDDEERVAPPVQPKRLHCEVFLHLCRVQQPLPWRKCHVAAMER